MSATAPPASRPPVRPQGLIAGLATLPFRLFGILCGSLLLSILVECVCMYFVWPEERWHHAEHMLQFELDQLSVYFRHSLIIQEPARLARALVDWTYDHLFIRSGISAWRGLTSPPTQALRGADRLRHLLSVAGTSIQPYVMAAGYTLLTFLVRVLVLCLTLPLFVMAGFVGLVDGLARRDIRRIGAGRESGFLYHRARASVLPIAALPWVTYLALPVSVHPLWILLPSAILLSIAVNLTAGSFKKYL